MGLSTLDVPTSPHRRRAADPGYFKIEEEHLLQFWESESTRPVIEGASSESQADLEAMSDRSLFDLLNHPFRPREEIRREQFERVREIVELAYNEVPVYAEKYRAVGFKPGDLKTWEDFERLPVITKDELMAADLNHRLSRRWPAEQLFSTRTFGSSGRTLKLKVNSEAILRDTLQGVRQFWLQSGLKYDRDHLTAMIYTVPWWYESVGGDFPTAFISGLITPEAVCRILNDLKPHVISCYPTNLKALIPFWGAMNRGNLGLVIVHSESSSPAERRRWSTELGVPVRDEYSSEEATRIALELPCGHYHVCEDAVYLEALDPETYRPQRPGTPGLAVVTNLLNEAMPFIRYVQGDYVTRPAKPGRCLIGWSQLASVNGRVNDSFINRKGREVPAGTILDLTYRWMFDTGVNLEEFELAQKAPDVVRATMQIAASVPPSKVEGALHHLGDLLRVCLGHPVGVEAEVVPKFPRRPGKRRPIRRDFVP